MRLPIISFNISGIEKVIKRTFHLSFTSVRSLKLVERNQKQKTILGVQKISFTLLFLSFSHKVMSDSATPCTAACQTHSVLHYLLKFAKNDVYWVGDASQRSSPCPSLTILSAAPFSSCLQSFSASGSFPMSRLFASGGQSIGASALASVLPVNIQGWLPTELTSLISLYF